MCVKSSVTRCLNKSTAVFTLIDIFNQNSQKSKIFLGYFSKRICCQELSKIAQSGPTGLLTHSLSFSRMHKCSPGLEFILRVFLANFSVFPNGYLMHISGISRGHRADENVKISSIISFLYSNVFSSHPLMHSLIPTMELYSNGSKLVCCVKQTFKIYFQNNLRHCFKW